MHFIIYKTVLAKTPKLQFLHPLDQDAATSLTEMLGKWG